MTYLMSARFHQKALLMYKCQKKNIFLLNYSIGGRGGTVFKLVAVFSVN